VKNKFFTLQRGPFRKAVELMISGFVEKFCCALPLEFAAEADKLLTKIRRKCWLMNLDPILEIKDLKFQLMKMKF
jgi:hypothetical protein